MDGKEFCSKILVAITSRAPLGFLSLGATTKKWPQRFGATEEPTPNTKSAMVQLVSGALWARPLPPNGVQGLANTYNTEKSSWG